MSLKEKHYAWRTENWLRIGGEVFMVQQRWTLQVDSYKTGRKAYKHRQRHYVPFPTDEWRIINLKEIVPDADFEKLVEAAEDERQ